VAVTYGEVQDVQVIDRVYARFAQEIATLEGLGFRKLCVASETFFPFSLILFSPIYLLARAYRHPTFLASPLRFGAYTPMMVSYETCVFAAPQPLGVKYYTRFMDGAVLVSANFIVSPVNDPDRGFFKYQDDKITMEQCHQCHQARIQDHIRADRWLDHDLQYDNLVRMSQFEDHYMYGAPLRKQKTKVW